MVMMLAFLLKHFSASPSFQYQIEDPLGSKTALSSNSILQKAIKTITYGIGDSLKKELQNVILCGPGLRQNPGWPC